MQVSCSFRSYTMDCFKKESNDRELIEAFNIDSEAKRLVVLQRLWNEHLGRYDKYYFKMYCLKTKKQLFSCQITDEPLIN